MCLTQLGRIVEIDGADRALVVDAHGSRARVSLAPLTLCGEVVAPGDWVLMHTGFAVERLGAADAAALIASLDELEDGAHP